jgi:AcrR family transcriptional regulator
VPRRGLDHAAVVELAAAIADREGLAAVTLARVAAEAGVRPPSLYNHVAGLEDLLRGIALLGVRELRAQLQAAAVGRAGDDALRAAAGAYRAYAHAHPGRYAAAMRAPAAGDDELAAEAAETVATVATLLRAWALPEDEVVHAVRAVRSALHGFVALEADGGFGLPVDREASFDRLVAALAAGLAPQADQGGTSRVGGLRGGRPPA